MAVTTTEVMILADQMADLLNRMTKEQWEAFQFGMLVSESPDYSQQMLMDGFATLISDNGCQSTWVWDQGEKDAAAEAEAERQRQIARGQLEMFPENEGRH